MCRNYIPIWREVWFSDKKCNPGVGVGHVIMIVLQIPVLSGKYQGGISRAVFPGKYRLVQYPQVGNTGKFWEI